MSVAPEWAAELRMIADAVARPSGDAPPALETLYNELAALHNRRENGARLDAREPRRMAGLNMMFDLMDIAAKDD